MISDAGMKRFLLLWALAFCLKAQSQLLPLIPYPNYVKAGTGSFIFNRFTGYRVDEEHPALNSIVHTLIETMHQQYGFNVLKAKEDKQDNYINFDIDSTISHPEGYSLIITPSMVNIKSKTPAGAFYALMSLFQLMPPPAERKTAFVEIPSVIIKDQPALSYRGIMLDVSRHFMSVGFLYKLVDLMALQKMNNLHLHLTDDQGWRLEIKKYPLLTAVGSKRNGTIRPKKLGEGNDNKVHQGFYTQEEMKGLVSYAASRYVNIIPEIEMPGHSSAAIAAYPQLSCFPDEPTSIETGEYSGVASLAVRSQKAKIVQENWGVFEDVLCPSEYSFGFMKDVLDEVMQIFPSKYIHIGGDECPKQAWKRSPFCQKLMMDSSLKDEMDLQSFFIRKIERHLNEKGRTLIGWDEILEGGLAPNAVVMSWRGESGGIEAAKQQHPVIMSPQETCYLNQNQSSDPLDTVFTNGYLPLEKVYQYNPIPTALKPEEASYVLGLQANLWTENIPNAHMAEFQLFPRAIALAEIGWTAHRMDFEQFVNRLYLYLDRLSIRQVNFSHHLFDIRLKSSYDTASKSLRITQQGVKDETMLYYSMDSVDLLSKGLPFENFVEIKKDQRLSIGVIIGDELVDRAMVKLTLNRATGKSMILDHPPAPQYAGNGGTALTNGMLADESKFKDPEWMGWNGEDFGALLQWPEKEHFRSVTLRFYNEPNSWIHLPSKVRVLASDDGIRYREITSRSIDGSSAAGVQPVFLNLNNLEAKFLKLEAVNSGEIPLGMTGAGAKSWLFVDEIIVR